MKICKPYKSAKPSHIVQGFGVNPTYYQPNGHIGLDLAFPYCYGTFLVAPTKVIIKNIINSETLDKDTTPLSRGYGILMQDFNNKNIEYLYWHCLPIFPVGIGQVIEQGEEVAQMGNSGFSLSGGKIVPIEIRTIPPYWGTHVHFERRENGVHTDPYPYIDWTIPIKGDILKESISILQKISNILKGRKT